MEQSKLYDFLRGASIAESSLKLYMNNLRRLNGGEFPRDFKFLKNTEKILGDLEKFKPNTRRSYLISIVTTLKHDPKMKKLYGVYYEHLDRYNKEGAKHNDKTETQKANWIEQSDVREIYERVTEEARPLLAKRKLSADEYDAVLKWVVLSLYVLQKPRRNADYQLSKLVNKYSDSNDKAFNYLDLSTGQWHFNNYKTKGTYKTQTVEATPEMLEVVRAFLRHHPQGKEMKKKSGSVMLLVDREGAPLTAVNAITRILNKVFQKKIGVSMLRSIYLTDKYGNKMNELQQDAHDLGTSTNVIQTQYVKTDGDSVAVGPSEEA